MFELQKEARFSAVCHRLQMNSSDPKPPGRGMAFALQVTEASGLEVESDES